MINRSPSMLLVVVLIVLFRNPLLEYMLKRTPDHATGLDHFPAPDRQLRWWLGVAAQTLPLPTVMDVIARRREGIEGARDAREARPTPNRCARTTSASWPGRIARMPSRCRDSATKSPPRHPAHGEARGRARLRTERHAALADKQAEAAARPATKAREAALGFVSRLLGRLSRVRISTAAWSYVLSPISPTSQPTSSPHCAKAAAAPGSRCAQLGLARPLVAADQGRLEAALAGAGAQLPLGDARRKPQRPDCGSASGRGC